MKTKIECQMRQIQESHVKQIRNITIYDLVDGTDKRFFNKDDFPVLYKGFSLFDSNGNKKQTDKD